MRLLLSCLLATIVSPALAGAPPEILALEGDISPIHDPAVVRQGGTYHLFASNRFAERLVPMFCSTDRRRWALCENGFDAVPAWALEEVPGALGIWAPDIALFRGRYPGDLCRYVGAAPAGFEMRVNGKRVEARLADGYAVLDRTWTTGDRVTLHLPMTVRRVVADERVVDDRGKVALERGPLVYCVEGIDNRGSVLDMVVPDGASFRVEDRPGLRHGVSVLRAAVSDGQGRPRSLLAVPYYAWSHRGGGEMAVWLTRGVATVPPRP